MRKKGARTGSRCGSPRPHGTIFANYAIDKCDLLLAFGVRFDDRVTGKVKDFAKNASIVHIDIDAAEIGKNKVVEYSVCADMGESWCRHGDLNMLLVLKAAHWVRKHS